MFRMGVDQVARKVVDGALAVRAFQQSFLEVVLGGSPVPPSPLRQTPYPPSTFHNAMRFACSDNRSAISACCAAYRLRCASSTVR